MAEGVLVLGVEAGTKQLAGYLHGSKVYRAFGLLGSETDTLDSTGSIVERADWSHVNEKLLADAMEKFRGNIFQTPPMFSALKKDGKRLYELARKGEVVHREPRPG